MGRFPSRTPGLAIGYRDGVCTNPNGVCTNPICHVPAARCDLDHVIPVPEGPTTASNLDDKCRSDHRAMAAPAIGNMMLRAGAPQRLSALGHVEVGQN